MSIVKNADGRYETAIGEDLYSFQKWDADTALEVLLDLIPVVGQPLGAALSTVMGKDEGIDTKVTPAVLADVFQALTGSFNKKIVKPILIKLVSQDVMCNDVPVKNFKSHYEGKMMLMFKVAYAGLEVQYGNFLEELLGLVASMETQPKDSNQEQ